MRRKLKAFTNNLLKLAQAKEKTGYLITTGVKKDLVLNQSGETIFEGFYIACVDFIVRESKRQD